MKKQKAIVVGSGRLGSHLASDLSLKGHDVTIVDKVEDSFRKLGDHYSGFRFIGDAIDSEILEKVGIKEADVIIVTTNNDNTNLFIGHIANMIYNVDKVYVRLSDDEKSTLIDDTDITAIYPFKLSTEAFNTHFWSDVE